MTAGTVEATIVETLKAGANGHLKIDETTGDTVFATVAGEGLKDLVRYALEEMGARFLISSATDHRLDQGVFEVVNWFALDAQKKRLALRTKVDPTDPSIESITSLIPGAAWTEREMRDMLGIEPIGHPDPRRLILPDDWPANLHPLRRDVPYDVNPEAVDDQAYETMKPPEGTSRVQVGPFFPTLEEPVFFNLFVDGEDIVDMDYRGFYSHRGIEKLADSVLTYDQIPFLAERICGICGFVHSTSYAQAVEKAVGIEVPRRGRYIRSIVLELERIHSHLLWIGLACHFIGFDTLFMQSWRIREPVMWLCEQVTGHRKTYGANIVGGVRRDIPNELHPKILDVLGTVEKELTAAVDAILHDKSLLMRLEGTGILTPEAARAYCTVGPTARGSGLAIDTRVDHPYAAYDELPVRACVYPEGDNWARTRVRIDETFNAIEIVRAAIQNMPDGPTRAEVGEIPSGKRAMSGVEAARGEVIHHVETGPSRPFRWRVRAPSYTNLQAIPAMLEDQKLADAPITIGSIDPCFSCTERMMVTNVKSGKSRVLTRKEIEAPRAPHAERHPRREG